MDEQILKTMPEYIQHLSKNVRDFVFEGVWEIRVREVATKYSLDDSQTEKLVDNVLFVLLGIDTPEEFQKTVSSELFISEFLTLQIMDDLGKRIFDYALNQIGEVGQKEFQSKQNESNNVLEIKPQITPSTEKGEIAHNTTLEEKEWFSEKVKTAPNSDQPTQKSTSSIPENLPGATPVEIPKTPEPVQKPVIGVPRYTVDSSKAQVASSKEEMKNSDEVKKENMVDKKLNSIVSSPSPAQTKTAPSYTGQDPYREPLE